MRRADKVVTFMCRLFFKSGSLSLLESSGPVQACTGLSLPLPLSDEQLDLTCVSFCTLDINMCKNTSYIARVLKLLALHVIGQFVGMLELQENVYRHVENGWK